MRTHENGAERILYPCFEIFLRAKELHRSDKVSFGDRPTICAPHQGRKNPFRICFLGLGTKNPSPARRVARAFCVIWTVDGHLIHRWPEARMPMHIEMGIVRLAPGLQQ